MCGRFTLRTPARDLVEIFELLREPELPPRYNIAPTQRVAVVRQSGKDREFAGMRWGLVPSWSKDPKAGPPLINARAETVATKGRSGYEIEHIWANHPERHEDEFTQQADFQEYRNRIGGLLLLPKSFNASFGDLPYAEKREHYLKQNLLAQSLHELAYERNPGFLRFAKERQFPFRAHVEFKKVDLDARQQLYRRLAEDLWNPGRLHRELTAEAGAA